MPWIFGSDEDQVNTNRVIGTFGSMSSEYAIEGRFSENSNVFNFEVLLLEIVGVSRNTSFYDDEQSLSLLGLAWKLWNADNTIALIDPMIYEPCFEMEILRCMQSGCCVCKNLLKIGQLYSLLFLCLKVRLLICLVQTNQHSQKGKLP